MGIYIQGFLKSSRVTQIYDLTHNSHFGIELTCTEIEKKSEIVLQFL